MYVKYIQTLIERSGIALRICCRVIIVSTCWTQSWELTSELFLAMPLFISFFPSSLVTADCSGSNETS
uniref:Uncharacterized protein n=1 Tax=Lepeophtheirus salmonis TaxID=72036 RepID=A0A0K2UNK1_LEPSM